MSESSKESARVKWDAIMNDPKHPYHSKLDTETRRDAIQEVLRLNEQLTAERG